LFLRWRDNPKIVAAMTAMRPAIAALIVYAAYRIGKTAAVDKTAVLLIAATVTVLYFGHSHIHPIFVILGGAAVGAAIVRIKTKAGAPPVLPQDEQVYDYMI
jgi:chromate transporter